MKISYSGSQQIDAWAEESNQLSTDAYNAMRDTAQLVEEIKVHSAGTLVDELISISGLVLEHTDKLSKTMCEMTDLVKRISNVIGNAATAASNILGGVARAFGGH